MRAYVYCSYKFSPAGFQMGTIEYDAAQKNFYVPTEGNLNKFVVAAFEEGIVKKIYGRLPDSGKYIFLVKKLHQGGIDDPNEGVIDFTMNFAFEFDSFDDYKNFCGNFNALTNPDAECANFMVTDRNVETFALKIDAEKFNGFVEKMLRASDDEQPDEKIFVEVISAKVEESKLEKIFGCAFVKIDAKKFCHPATNSASCKKKNFPMILIGTVIAILVVAGIFLLR